MTKYSSKEYNLIANVFYEDEYTHGYSKVKRRVLNEFADFFAKDNPKFNREYFMEKATVQYMTPEEKLYHLIISVSGARYRLDIMAQDWLIMKGFIGSYPNAEPNMVSLVEQPEFKSNHIKVVGKKAIEIREWLKQQDNWNIKDSKQQQVFLDNLTTFYVPIQLNDKFPYVIGAIHEFDFSDMWRIEIQDKIQLLDNNWKIDANRKNFLSSFKLGKAGKRQRLRLRKKLIKMGYLRQ